MVTRMLPTCALIVSACAVTTSAEADSDTTGPFTLRAGGELAVTAAVRRLSAWTTREQR
jgi:hypothetical protein